MELNMIQALPEIFLAVFGIFVLLMGQFAKKENVSGIVKVISLFGLFAALVITGNMAADSGGAFVVDSFAVFFKVLFILAAIIVVIGSFSTLKTIHESEYYSLILFITLGMCVVASARELILLFVGIELAGISSFVLAGYTKEDRRSSEAAIKYLVVAAVSSAIILFGMSIIYGVSGSTNYTGIAGSIGSSPAALLGLVLIISGIGYKITAVPFHMWAPDTYEGAPAQVSALLASGLKKMGIAALIPLLFIALLSMQAQWQVVFAVLATATMTLGNIVALSQKSVKRMLAYSSVAQAGYILIGFAVATKLSVASALFYCLAHTVMAAGTFIIIAALVYVKIGENLEDYAGLWKRAPFMAFAMMIILLSLAGIPPLVGFWGKFWLFMSAVEAGMVWLAVIGVLNSALSLYYYFAVVKFMFFKEPASHEKLEIPVSATVAVAIALLCVILFGLFPDAFMELCFEATEGLGIIL
ncbi:hypothetical protein BEH94_00385 [Candidatus Altiarchaeales archaeon WOR_SM1_SCG]|nr:hypothetical protein BEH94_00385 [Candidatus Altiarchaeales archaeon WOR_SM1_SCG]